MIVWFTPVVVNIPLLFPVVTTFPVKSEFKTTVPAALNFKSSTGPVETLTRLLKRGVPTAATSI